jgi:Ca2+-binding EF-hand superfamily protein
MNNNGTIDFTEFMTADTNLTDALAKDNLKAAFNNFDVVLNPKLNKIESRWRT